MSVITGASDWAESSYNEAIKLEPSNPFAYLELGRLDENRADAITTDAQKNPAIKKQWDEYMDNALVVGAKAIVKFGKRGADCRFQGN